MTDSGKHQTALFDPGQIALTRLAMQAIYEQELNFADFLSRHLLGEWGDLNDEDKKRNDWALQNGERILSKYPLDENQDIYIITEYDRSLTTVMLKEEY